MPVYREKKYEKREVYHTETKDGKKVFVKGAKPDPYKDIKCSSLSLDARIESGVFEDHEGGPRHLEKVQGSDVMTAEIENQQKKYEEAKSNAEKAQFKKRVNQFVEENVLKNTNKTTE